MTEVSRKSSFGQPQPNEYSGREISKKRNQFYDGIGIHETLEFSPFQRNKKDSGN